MLQTASSAPGTSATRPQRAPRAKKRRRRALIAGAAIACVVVAGWNPILSALGRFLIVSDRPERSDLIIVLGGDFWGPRVLKGAELGVQGFAPRVLISGPPYHGRPESELAIRFLSEKGYPPGLFFGVPHSATSTVDEAIALAPELRRLNVRTAILVTRASHSRRAGIVFRLFCPDIRFRSVSAADDQFEPEQWWTDRTRRRVFLLEWSKILGTVLLKYPQFRIRDLVGDRAP